VGQNYTGSELCVNTEKGVNIPQLCQHLKFSHIPIKAYLFKPGKKNPKTTPSQSTKQNTLYLKIPQHGKKTWHYRDHDP